MVEIPKALNINTISNHHFIQKALQKIVLIFFCKLVNNKKTSTYQYGNSEEQWGRHDHESPSCWESKKYHFGNGWPLTACIRGPYEAQTTRGIVSSSADVTCVLPMSSYACGKITSHKLSVIHMIKEENNNLDTLWFCLEILKFISTLTIERIYPKTSLVRRKFSSIIDHLFYS